MRCNCGKSEIPDSLPNSVDVILCPNCRRRYGLVKFRDKKTGMILKRMEEIK